jgi:hypothetical protein
VPPASEQVRADPRCAGDQELFLADTRVQELVSDKIAEVVGYFPEAEGYIYSNHESQLATFAHTCDACKALPLSDRVRCLYRAVREGVDRVAREMTVVVRLWGMTHSRELFYENRRELTRLFDHDPGYWPSRRLPALRKLRPEPAALHAALPQMLRAGDMVMMKATWGDVHLGQPDNPYIEKYGGTPRIVELSCEHGLMGGLIPLVMSAQHQRMIQQLGGDGVQFAVVPINWGRSYVGSESLPDSAAPSTWGINALNIYLCGRLLQQPDLDVVAAAREWFKNRYAAVVSQQAVARIFDAAGILARALNVRGVATAVNVGQLLRPATYQLKTALINTLWNRNHFPDGRRRTSPSDTNMRRIMAEKDAAQAAAMELVEAALTDAQAMSDVHQLQTEYVSFFQCFGDLASYLCVSRKRLWLQYKLAADKTLNYHPWQRELDALIAEEQQLIAASTYLQGIHNGRFKQIEQPSVPVSESGIMRREGAEGHG